MRLVIVSLYGSQRIIKGKSEQTRFYRHIKTVITTLKKMYKIGL